MLQAAFLSSGHDFVTDMPKMHKVNFFVFESEVLTLVPQAFAGITSSKSTHGKPAL